MDGDVKLTWGELKERVEAMGVDDGDQIDFIDISWGSLSNLRCQKDEDFGWQIFLDND